MLLALFTGAANAFVSITGEKQLRVTEQVVSAIPPQSWIDGKILGLTGVALVGAFNTALVVLAFMLWRSYSRGTGGLGITSVEMSPVTVIVFVVLVLLGSLFWLSLFGAVAATIDDPNSSMRSTLLFLPMFAAAPAVAAIPNPDSTFARIVGLFPLTSPIGLPVRMLLGHTPWWEIVLSIALLAAATWWMRLAAGRIFRFGMLMYGKEASWGEMRRWAGKA
jgi:ABC-2 type transport system permease protein